MNKYKHISDQKQFERFKERSCLNKTAYDTRKQAQIPNVQVYWCKLCDKYHRHQIDILFYDKKGKLVKTAPTKLKKLNPKL